MRLLCSASVPPPSRFFHINVGYPVRLLLRPRQTAWTLPSGLRVDSIFYPNAAQEGLSSLSSLPFEGLPKQPADFFFFVSFARVVLEGCTV